jgi:phospholipase/carboxylesterase
MKIKANDNPDSPENQFDSICKQLIEVLARFSIFQRQFFPPEFPTLRTDLLALQMSVKKITDELGQITAPTEHNLPWAVTTDVSGLLLDALELILDASPENMQDVVTRAMRSFRRICRIQEKLYAIHTMSPELNRFFLEPQANDRAPNQQHGVAVGLQHVGLENAYYARGALSLYVPESYDETVAWPLVIALHGGFGHGRDFIWTWLREARSRGYVLMAPTSIQTTWSLLDPDLDGAALITMLDYVKHRWNIDTTQILLTGISDGATFALVSALQPKPPFTAFAPIAGVLPPIDLTAAKNKRIYWVHGALDWMFPLQSARTGADALSSAGAEVIFRAIDDLSHTYPREENGPILDWFTSGRV